MKILRPRDLECPSCGGNNRDGKVCLFPDGNIFCHSCGSTTISPENANKPTAEFEFIPEVYKDVPSMVIQQYFKGKSTLEEFLYSKFYTTDVMKSLTLYELGCGTRGNMTAFIYKDIDQRYRYVKLVQYLPNGKRDKDQHFPFYSVYKSTDGFKACLFGEHLLKGHSGSVNLVESEKTAIIANIKYPNQLWLASGGSHGLTYDKAQHLRGRRVYKYVDCDVAGRNVDQDRKRLNYFNAELIIKDIDPSRNDGADLADLILEQI